MQRVHAGHRAIRIIRQKRMADRQEPVTRAVAICQALDHEGLLEVGVRTGFIRLDNRRVPFPSGEEGEGSPRIFSGLAERWKRDWSTRPPATQLVARRSNALPFYLTSIYLAHLRHAPKEHVVNPYANATTAPDRPSWAALSGLGWRPNQRARRTRVTRALTELERARLVDLKRTGATVSYEGFQLLREDGSDEAYLVPGLAGGGLLKLPGAFFFNGWHLVLEPGEIAVLLAILDMTKRVGPRGHSEEPGVALPESERWGYYGLSGEVYESVHELEDFGLIRIHDPLFRQLGKWQPQEGRSPDDETSFAPVPYRFVLTLDGLDKDAWSVVSQSLASELPERFRL